MGEDKFNGITVEGRPLSQYLDEEHRSMVEEFVDGEVLIHRRNMSPISLRKRFRNQCSLSASDKRNMTSKVRYLTQEEIEKEYGPMTEPETNKTKLALNLLKSRGTVTSSEIQKTINWKSEGAASSILGKFAKIWPEGIVVDKSTTPYRYTMTSPLRRTALDDLYQVVLDYQKREYHKFMEKKKKKEPSPPPTPPVSEEPPHTHPPDEPPHTTTDVPKAFTNQCPICNKPYLTTRRNEALGVVLWVHHSTTYRGEKISWTEVEGCTSVLEEGR